jgi:hypothetical protein
MHCNMYVRAIRMRLQISLYLHYCGAHGLEKTPIWCAATKGDMPG